MDRYEALHVAQLALELEDATETQQLDAFYAGAKRLVIVTAVDALAALTARDGAIYPKEVKALVWFSTVCKWCDVQTAVNAHDKDCEFYN
jgi:hypothetical protein